jgi:hypothetical protein
MKFTTSDCLVAIDKFWPDFRHAYANLHKQKWRRDIKIKNEQGRWVRYFTAFEDQHPIGGYNQTWLKVTETDIDLVVSHLSDTDRAFLRAKYSFYNF